MAMNVSLTPELEKMIQDKVASGAYQTASEVVREALRLVQERDAARERERAWVEYANEKVKRGLADIEAGRVSTEAEVKTWLRNRRRKRA